MKGEKKCFNVRQNENVCSCTSSSLWENLNKFRCIISSSSFLCCSISSQIEDKELKFFLANSSDSGYADKTLSIFLALRCCFKLSVLGPATWQLCCHLLPPPVGSEATFPFFFGWGVGCTIITPLVVPGIVLLFGEQRGQTPLMHIISYICDHLAHRHSSPPPDSRLCPGASTVGFLTLVRKSMRRRTCGHMFSQAVSKHNFTTQTVQHHPTWEEFLQKRAWPHVSLFILVQHGSSLTSGTLTKPSSLGWDFSFLKKDLSPLC